MLVPPADEKALADAIMALLSDEGLRAAFGAAGKKRAEDFNVANIMRQYEDVIYKVCAASAGK